MLEKEQNILQATLQQMAGRLRAQGLRSYYASGLLFWPVCDNRKLVRDGRRFRSYHSIQRKQTDSSFYSRQKIRREIVAGSLWSLSSVGDLFHQPEADPTLMKRNRI